jgi:hypothetical protein
MFDSFGEELTQPKRKLARPTKQSPGQINYLYKSTDNCSGVIKTPASFACRRAVNSANVSDDFQIALQASRTRKMDGPSLRCFSAAGDFSGRVVVAILVMVTPAAPRLYGKKLDLAEVGGLN